MAERFLPAIVLSPRTGSYTETAPRAYLEKYAQVYCLPLRRAQQSRRHFLDHLHYALASGQTARTPTLGRQVPQAAPYQSNAAMRSTECRVHAACAQTSRSREHPPESAPSAGACNTAHARMTTAPLNAEIPHTCRMVGTVAILDFRGKKNSALDAYNSVCQLRLARVQHITSVTWIAARVFFTCVCCAASSLFKLSILATCFSRSCITLRSTAHKRPHVFVDAPSAVYLDDRGNSRPCQGPAVAT